jgi:hypothetical protein
MRNINAKKEFRSIEEIGNKDIERNNVNNDCYLTRYFYEGNTNAQGDSLILVDDQHGNQKRRYYNSRRGV